MHQATPSAPASLPASAPLSPPSPASRRVHARQHPLPEVREVGDEWRLITRRHPRSLEGYIYDRGQLIPDMPLGTFGFRISERLTREDYLTCSYRLCAERWKPASGSRPFCDRPGAPHGAGRRMGGPEARGRLGSTSRRLGASRGRHRHRLAVARFALFSWMVPARCACSARASSSRPNLAVTQASAASAYPAAERRAATAPPASRPARASARRATTRPRGSARAARTARRSRPRPPAG